jgi:hypothetical protein
MKGVEQRRKLLSKERWRKGKAGIPRESKIFMKCFTKQTHIRSYDMETPWSESARGLYRKSDRRLAKLGQRLRIDGVSWTAQRIPTSASPISTPEPLLFLPSSSSIVLTRLSGPTTSQKIW